MLTRKQRRQEEADIYAAFADYGYHRHGRIAVWIVRAGHWGWLIAFAMIAFWVIVMASDLL